MTNTQPAIIRAFFAAFAEGVLSESVDHQDAAVELTPQRIKRIMLDHYEAISKHFFDVLFNPLALIHYDSAEELIAILHSPEVAPTLKTPMDLFKYVCRTEEAHEDMVAEYRRNFTSLLAGHILTIDEFYDGFPEGYLQDTTSNVEREVRALTQTVVRAFFAGRGQAISEATAKGQGDGTQQSRAQGVNQIYLFRLLVDNMQCLMSSKPIVMSDEADLNETFLAVCRTPENMNTMLETMQRTLMEVQEK